jgi:hypothetical protein
MPALKKIDLTYSCAELGLHHDRCSRPESCWCDCHQKDDQ